MLIVEPVLDEASPRGSQTFVDLTLGLAAVIERLEYGAAKHPDEPWQRHAASEHLERLSLHVQAIFRPRPDQDRSLAAIRKHVAAAVCRGLMFLTVDAMQELGATTIIGGQPYGPSEFERVTRLWRDALDHGGHVGTTTRAIAASFGALANGPTP